MTVGLSPRSGDQLRAVSKPFTESKHWGSYGSQLGRGPTQTSCGHSPLTKSTGRETVVGTQERS